MEHALNAVHMSLEAVRASQLFTNLHTAQVNNILQTIKRVLGFNLAGIKDNSLQNVGDVLSKVCQLLATEHPVLRLFIQAACVKALSKDMWNEDQDEDSEEQEGPEGMEAEAGADPSANPLAHMSAAKIADYLLERLQEQQVVRSKFITYATKFGPDGVWQLLQDMNAELANDGAMATVSQGDRKRTAGGLFLKMAKAKESADLKAAQQAQAPAFELRPYQVEAVDTISAQGGNWVVAAPTNTGKTAIFIELSRRCLHRKPGGTVVVLVPTVSLVQQQCNAYEEHRYFRPASGATHTPADLPSVDWFCGDKPLQATMWKDEVKRLGVIIIEGQSFANLLASKKASLADIDMLVLDECHHAAKSHPYARVMESFSALPPGSRPQVLGFSASPANGKSELRNPTSAQLGLQAALEASLERLLTLMDARLFVVSEDDDLVKRIAPGPAEEEVLVGTRPQDGYVLEFMRHLMHACAMHVDVSLAHQLNSTSVEDSSHNGAMAELGALPLKADVTANPMAAYNQLCKWMNGAMTVARAWKLPNLGQCVQVLEVLRRAEALCADMGYECALHYAAQRIVLLVCGPGALEDEVLIGPSPPKKPKLIPLDPALVIGDALSALDSHVLDGPRSSDIAQAAAEARQSALARLPPCADIPLSPRQLCRTLLDALITWDGRRSPLAACDMHSKRVPMKVVELDTPTPPATPAAQDLSSKAVLSLLPGGLDAPPVCHPKTWELVQFLRKYKKQKEFHGIVFCRSRQVAHYLVEVLRAACLPGPGSGSASARPAALLGFIDDVTLFVGHGGQTDDKSRSIAPGRDGLYGGVMRSGEGLAARGMSVRQQSKTLDQFKSPGRKVLVATNAAEEGLDLPCCEFVVRFSPPATGIQRVQGRGRARKLGANYICLIQPAMQGSLQHGGVDQCLNAKSNAEEQVLKRVLNKVVTKQMAMAMA